MTFEEARFGCDVSIWSMVTRNGREAAAPRARRRPQCRQSLRKAVALLLGRLNIERAGRCRTRLNIAGRTSVCPA